MNMRLVKLITIAALTGYSLFMALSGNSLSGKGAHAASNNEYVGTGFGTAQALEASYNEWEAQYVKEGGDRNWVIPIGWFKGLSTENTYASGKAMLNLIDGTVSVDVKGLTVAEGWDVWLVDNGVGSILPEAGENMLRIGSLRHEGKVARLKADLGSRFFADFELDLIVVTRARMSPIENRALAGTTTLFHRLYRTKQRGEFGRLSDHPKPETTADKRGLFARLLDAVLPTAQAQIGPQEGVNNLITRGRNSFFNQTFNGNGRTCGTCHREDESLTISPEFISTLPQNDPLFVAETQPALAKNFENPVLMRKLGLILENVDGFDDLENKFVMRGVPHTLALLPNTLLPALQDGTTIPPNERTGWGGDGAPGTGTLREFITGAITQHYPKTLARVPAGGGIAGDFRLATVAEMDELEAFMKSTGRRADLVLSGPGALSLKNEVAALGQAIFINPSPFFGIPNNPNIAAGNCFLCHVNAGAGDFFELGRNANFNTNVEGLPAQPADLVKPLQLNPQDGGFGVTGTSPTGGIGNGSFNTPALVEAADTGPFFHNNAIDTIEGAVDFYNSDAFNKAPGFGGVITNNAGLIKLAATEVVAIAAFMRSINALENIRSARDLAVRARNSTNLGIVNELLRLAIAEAEDALKVLNSGNLNFRAQVELRKAIAALTLALEIRDKTARDAKINEAIGNLDTARGDIRN
jgi:hypothetical protein